jgi:superfamily II DNA/RNA helicase
MKAGVPSVELHGNLSQSARARNLAAFAAGRADTLVATDIAARGIHVDDVSLVIHADPPEEHKAYLHRSGRTARAGASGTVVTLMTDKQRRSVRALTKQAGIFPTTTKVAPNHPFLNELAPGDRVFVETASINMHPAPERTKGGRSSEGPRQFNGHRNGSGRNASGRNGSGNRGSGYAGNNRGPGYKGQSDGGRGHAEGGRPGGEGGRPGGEGGRPGGEKKYGSAGKQRNKYRGDRKPR